MNKYVILDIIQQIEVSEKEAIAINSTEDSQVPFPADCLESATICWKSNFADSGF